MSAAGSGLCSGPFATQDRRQQFERSDLGCWLGIFTFAASSSELTNYHNTFYVLTYLLSQNLSGKSSRLLPMELIIQEHYVAMNTCQKALFYRELTAKYCPGIQAKKLHQDTETVDCSFRPGVEAGLSQCHPPRFSDTKAEEEPTHCFLLAHGSESRWPKKLVIKLYFFKMKEGDQRLTYLAEPASVLRSSQQPPWSCQFFS